MSSPCRDYAELVAALPAMRAYAWRLCRNAEAAAELVQATAERALVKWALFQPGTNRRKWLLAIMHNVHINRWRRELKEVPIEALPADGGTVVAQAISDPSIGLVVRDMQRALDRLSVGQREPVLLVGLDGMGWEAAREEIVRRHTQAGYLFPDVPMGTIRSRLSRGREALRAADIL